MGMGMGNGMGRGRKTVKGNSEGNGISNQTPGGDDISCAVALPLQKELYKAGLYMEAKLERVY
jgi:hypothetical protein